MSSGALLKSCGLVYQKSISMRKPFILDSLNHDLIQDIQWLWILGCTFYLQSGSSTSPPDPLTVRRGGVMKVTTNVMLFLHCLVFCNLPQNFLCRWNVFLSSLHPDYRAAEELAVIRVEWWAMQFLTCSFVGQGYRVEAEKGTLWSRPPLICALRKPWHQQLIVGWEEKASKVAAVWNVRKKMPDMPAFVLPFHGGSGKWECRVLPGMCTASCGEAEVVSRVKADVSLRWGTNNKSCQSDLWEGDR